MSGVLVAGGAGYIGSVVVEALIAHGVERVVVLDDLSKGHRAAVIAPARLEVGDISDRELVLRLCKDHGIDAMVHLAASSLVGESVQLPAKYYDNNVRKGLAFLDAAVAAGVKRFVLSSTAAVYGEPARTPIDENLPTIPTNPYGDTKLALERALHWYEQAYGLRYASLRYFNAAGATERNGERHDPETHLIPIVLDVARGMRPEVGIFGTDYPTPDGTCVRDYIHVSDLANAHVLALDALREQGSRIYNLGCGGGFSVRQVIDAAREVTGCEIKTVERPRRAGDPAILVASSERIRRELGWSPVREDIRAIVNDAWAWLQRNPQGYSE